MRTPEDIASNFGYGGRNTVDRLLNNESDSPASNEGNNVGRRGRRGAIVPPITSVDTPVATPVVTPTPEAPVIAIAPPYPTDAVAINPPQKTDITLYGFYRDINSVTIPVDNDLNNVIVVPNTTFPYVAIIENYSNAKGRRYISEFTYLNLVKNYETNLGKIISDMDESNGNYSYIRLDWKKFDNLITKNIDIAKKEGGVVKPKLSPEFLLQWLEGNKLTYVLDYSYIIPKGVKTIGDLNPSTTDKESNIVNANIAQDDARKKKLEVLLSVIAGAASFYGIAQSALGNIKSRFSQAKGLASSLQSTAEGLADKFNDTAGQLNKDALEGKVNQLKDTASNLKSSVKSRVPRIKAKLKQEVEEKKKKLKRKPKDPKAKKKFSLQNFQLPAIPPVPQPPQLPSPPNVGDLSKSLSKSFTGTSVDSLKGQLDDAKNQATQMGEQAKNVVGTSPIPSTTSTSTSTNTSKSTSTSTSITSTSTTTSTTSGTIQGVVLQLVNYKSDRNVGYGLGKSLDQTIARQIASHQATVDLAKKLNKTTISASEFDSKTYLLPGNLYQVEVVIKQN
jgi:hypothetical protein